MLYALFWVIPQRLNCDDDIEMSKHVAVYIIYIYIDTKQINAKHINTVRAERTVVEC